MYIHNQLFLTVLNMSITAGYVTVAVVILRLLLRRLPKKITVFLWLAVGFRLVFPFSFQSSLSFLRIFRLPKDTGATVPYIPENIGYMEQPEITTGIPALNSVVNPALPAATPENSVNPMQLLTFFGSLVWLLGILTVLTISVVSCVRLWRRLRTATLLPTEELPAGFPGTVPVYCGEAVPSPFIFGVLRPRIYLPYGLTETEIRCVLAHEAVHLRYRDHLTKPSAFLLLAVHWFNPLVWLAFCLLGRDLELRCDEAVLSEFETEPATAVERKKEYGTVLLSFAAGHRFTALAFGETGIGERVKNILRFRRPALWVTILTGVLALSVCLILAANPKEPEPLPWMRTAAPNTVEIVEVGVAKNSTLLSDIETYRFINLLRGVKAEEIIKVESRAVPVPDLIIYLKDSSSERRLQLCASTLYHIGADQSYRIDNTALVTFLKGLPQFPSYGIVFDHAEIIYDAPMFSFSYTSENVPDYAINDDHVLSERARGGVWVTLGQMEPLTLTKNNFDDAFYKSDYPGWADKSAAELRKNNDTAWRLNLPPDEYDNCVTYTLLCQTDGTLYLTYGYYDEAEETTLIRWVFRLGTSIATGDYVICEYFSAISSQLPGFYFECDFPHTEIVVTTDQGELWFDAAELGFYSHSEQLTLHPEQGKSAFRWRNTIVKDAPENDDSPTEDTIPQENHGWEPYEPRSEANLIVKAYTDGVLTYRGTIRIEPLEDWEVGFETPFMAQYYKASFSGEGLRLSQHPSYHGAILQAVGQPNPVTETNGPEN